MGARVLWKGEEASDKGALLRRKEDVTGSNEEREANGRRKEELHG